MRRIYFSHILCLTALNQNISRLMVALAVPLSLTRVLPSHYLLIAALLSLLPLLTLSYNKIQLFQTGNNQLKVKKAQITSSNEMEIVNYYNYQYYCKLEVGTPPQQESVILDTGSHHLWVPAKNCSNCPWYVHRFNPNKSSTSVVTNQREYLRYGKGEIKGYYIDDKVGFDSISTTVEFVLADYQKDTEHSQADGIMGLSNYLYRPNIFEQAYKEGQLASSKFGFRLGLNQLKEKSFFFYNITNEDFSEAVYLNASLYDYWTISVRDLRVGQQSFRIKHALVDSGTSLIIMPQHLYKEFDQAIFSQFCQPQKNGQLRKCKCPSGANYPNITLVSAQVSFNITPQAYILGSYSNRDCSLGIVSMNNTPIDFLILGDVFFHHRVVIFDKEKNRIGFIDNSRLIEIYPNSDVLVYILNGLGIGLILAAILILGLRRKDNYGRKIGNPLTEPLRIGGNVEMVRSVEPPYAQFQ